MKSLIHNSKTMHRKDTLLMLVVTLASLIGLVGTAVFLTALAPAEGQMTGLQPLLLSLTATLIYSGLMGGILYLLHPQKGLVLSLARDR